MKNIFNFETFVTESYREEAEAIDREEEGVDEPFDETEDIEADDDMEEDSPEETEAAAPRTKEYISSFHELYPTLHFEPQPPVYNDYEMTNRSSF